MGDRWSEFASRCNHGLGSVARAASEPDGAGGGFGAPAATVPDSREPTSSSTALAMEIEVRTVQRLSAITVINPYARLHFDYPSGVRVASNHA